MVPILVVTLNPAIDVTYEVPQLAIGCTNRVQRMWRMPGGKGINVLRVLQSLSVPATGVGFLAGHAGQWVGDALGAAGMSFEAVMVPGETRSTIAVLDIASVGSTASHPQANSTEIIEPGPTVDLSRADELLARVVKRAQAGGYVVLSGSQPQGLPLDFSAKVLKLARRLQCTTCLDASGEVLSATLREPPDIVKVNESEFRAWLGAPADPSPAAVIRGATKLIEAGAQLVVITQGALGSLVVSDQGQWHISAPDVRGVNPVGSGDAYFAGLIGGLATGQPLLEALTLAAACGASNATFVTAGSIERADVRRLSEQVAVFDLASKPESR